jgi:N-acyl homoserine lactone hydrolase
MSLEIKRLHLAELGGPDGRRWPVHGFVVTHPGGDWFDFMNARFELLDGDAEVLPGLAVMATPGHTVGHQSVVVRAADGSPDVLIGDAAYTPRQYLGPADGELPPGQASDLAAWRGSLRRIRSMDPARVHFCHHTDVIHS